MSDYELLELASAAIAEVSRVATVLAAEQRLYFCGKLGGQLFILAQCLRSIGSGREYDQKQQRKIKKLLLHVETIISLPIIHYPESGYPCLQAISSGKVGTTLYDQAKSKIRRGLLAFESKVYMDPDAVIAHLSNFEKNYDTKPPVIQEMDTRPKVKPADCSSDLKGALYKALRDHMYCICTTADPSALPQVQHRARLLLRSALQDDEDARSVRLDMLYSSAHSKPKPDGDSWQDIDVLLLRDIERPRKRVAIQLPNSNVKIAGTCEEEIEPRTGKSLTANNSEQNLEAIQHERFCELIRQDSNLWLRLVVRAGKLHRRLGAIPARRMFKQAPSISFATIIQTFELNARMKASLAFILAQSVWYLYDSDWMRMPWTRDTIHFLEEFEHPGAHSQSRVFASRPYLSIRFDDSESKVNEAVLDGEIHRYPRIRALGVLLVEIGKGESLAQNGNEGRAGVNGEWMSAKQESMQPDAWPDFDYPAYRAAVQYCLEPTNFDMDLSAMETDQDKLAEGIRHRRKRLFDFVVSPLEELVRYTGWKDKIDTLPAVESLATNSWKKSKHDTTYADPVRGQDPAQSRNTYTSEIARPGHAIDVKTQAESEEWLRKICLLHEELLPERRPTRPVKIAILDTGCDTDATFFNDRRRYRRIKAWKDFAAGARKSTDCDGHGTFLVSLIMRIAPQADIYVARVAASSADLSISSENVASAIRWAEHECEVDIVSMSFGFPRPERSISAAIQSAVLNRYDSPILFFAAAANSGANEREMFPASHKDVISIRGTGSDGQFQNFNPPKTRETSVLGTLGLLVPSASLSSIESDCYKSGTSVATAVAVGLAAMLLGFIDSRCGGNGDQSMKNKPRTRDGMVAVLETIATETREPGYKYIAPWILRDKNQEDRWVIIKAAILGAT